MSATMAEPALESAEFGGSGSVAMPSPDSRQLSTVMFMWQPYSPDLVYPSVTLLASFQVGVTMHCNSSSLEG